MLPRTSSIKKGVAGLAMQLGLRVLKAHALDSATVVGKRCTRLTSVAEAIKIDITCRRTATVQRQPP
jgi:hypothetical protein